MSLLKKITPLQWIFIIVILIAASYFRFTHITDQGFLYWDEGMYMNEAKFYSSLWENKAFVLDQLTSGFNAEEFIARIDGWPSSAVKPLHGLMIFLFSLIIGLHDYTGQIFSAVAALACLWLVFTIIAKYESVPTALIALLILAVSPYHIMFSRSAFPEIDSALFYYLSFFFYLNSLRAKKSVSWSIFLAGIFFGCTLVTNYRWFILIPSFMLFDMVNLKEVLKQGKFSLLKRMTLIGCGAACVIAVIDLPYVLVQNMVSLPVEFSSYHEQSTHYVALIFSHLKNLSIRPLYARIFIDTNGYMLLSFLLLGTIAIIADKKRTPCAKCLTLLFYYVFIGISLVKKGYFARYYSVVYPAAVFIMARGIHSFSSVFLQRKILRNTLLCMIVCAIILRGSINAYPFTHIRSGYREARNYLVSVNGKEHLSTTNSVFEFYFGRNVPDHLYKEFDTFLEQMEKKNYTHLVVDYVQFDVPENNVQGLYKYLRENETPIMILQNPMGACLPVVLESTYHNDYPIDNYKDLINDLHTYEIRIYSTEGLVERIKGYMKRSGTH